MEGGTGQAGTKKSRRERRSGEDPQGPGSSRHAREWGETLIYGGVAQNDLLLEYTLGEEDIG